MRFLAFLFACAPEPAEPPVDLDGDGFSPPEDCNDDARLVNPDAEDEHGDEIDQNCDGVDGVDLDGDGWANAFGEDCNDVNADVHPGAEDEPYDGLDADCAGGEEDDLDDDRHDAIQAGGDDCDDQDAGVYPGAGETCDGVDEDCDGVTDNDALDAPAWHPDADGDGYGAGDEYTLACDAPAGWLADAGDCDDADETRSPGAVDLCGDGVDSDCDGGTPDCGLRGDVDRADADVTLSAADGELGTRAGGGLDLLGDGAPAFWVASAQAFHDDVAIGVFAGATLADADLADADASLVQAEQPRASESAAVGGAAPDLTGDGLPDLLLGLPAAGDDEEGAVLLFAGPFAGALTTSDPVGALEGATRADALGTLVEAPGDLTGDGAADLVAAGGSGEVWIFAGPIEADGTTVGAAAHLATGGTTLAGADADGDGVVDLLVGGGDDGRARLYLGPLAGELGGADVVFTDAVDADLPLGVGAAWLVDGGGAARLAMNGAGGAAVYLFDAPFSGELAPSDAALTVEPETAEDAFGASLAGVDVDGDGADDLAVAAPEAENGTVFVFTALSTGTRRARSADATLGSTVPGFGSAVGSAGDLDGDGAEELWTGTSLESGSGADEVLVWYGGGGT